MQWIVEIKKSWLMHLVVVLTKAFSNSKIYWNRLGFRPTVRMGGVLMNTISLRNNMKLGSGKPSSSSVSTWDLGHESNG